MTALLYGKKAPVFPASIPMLGDIIDIAATPIPELPAIVHAPKLGADWGMMGNNEKGNCTIAGAGHEEMVFKFITKKPTVVPTAAQAISVYDKLTHNVDSGLVISDVLAAQRKNGLFSTEDELAGGGYVQVDHTKPESIKESVAFVGVSKLGIQCPASAQTAAQEQMATGKVVPWAYDPHSPIEGGHDIEAVGYNDDGFWCVSWGMLVLVEFEFLAKLGDEAWAPLPKQYREAGHGPLNIKWVALDPILDEIAA